MTSYNNRRYERQTEITPQTGDIVLFSGKGVFSNIIKTVTQSSITHVGVIIRLNICLQGVFVFESTNSFDDGIPNYLGGKSGKKNGTRLVLLYDLIEKYNGEYIYIRQLTLDIKRIPNMIVYESKILQFLNRVKDRLYENNIKEFFKSIYGGTNRRTKRDNQYLFCSEAVVLFLQYMGILGSKPCASHYTPKELSSTSKKDLPMVINAKYLKDICIFTE